MESASTPDLPEALRWGEHNPMPTVAPGCSSGPRDRTIAVVVPYRGRTELARPSSAGRALRKSSARTAAFESG